MTAQRSFLLVLELTVITLTDTALGASLLGGLVVAVPTFLSPEDECVEILGSPFGKLGTRWGAVNVTG